MLEALGNQLSPAAGVEPRPCLPCGQSPLGMHVAGSRSATLVAGGRQHRLQRKGGLSGPAFVLGHETRTRYWLQLPCHFPKQDNASHIKQESSWAKQRVTTGGSWGHTSALGLPNISRNLVLAFTATLCPPQDPEISQVSVVRVPKTEHYEK
jgi:hypothetical protein